jgi:uncharacterized protein YjiK
MNFSGKYLILNILIYLIWADAISQAAHDPVIVNGERAVVKISRTWDLPHILREISGISYIDAERIACVQDEVGTIYIYNISSRSVESEIPFGPPGDYEALAIVNDDAYVAVADGRIIEITGYRSGKPSVKEYGTHLTVKQNVEGLCYDKANKRLLVAIKGHEEGSPLYKGIYTFDLAAKAMPVKPVMKIDLQDSIFQRSSVKKPQTLIQPSEIAIHPSTGDIYICDAVRSQLLIMDNAGKIKALYALNKSKFIHPEGIMFTPSGELYISSEGNRQLPGKLMLVELD